MSVLIVIFEIIGTVAFSISGVIVDQKKKMDLLGVLIMGLVTAVGGGITRDIFLGQTPPKAFINPMLPIISIVTSLAVFLLVTKYGVKEPNVYYNRIFFIMDSIGLAVFTVVGIEVSQSVYGFNLLLNLFMGTLTSVGGGVMRDLFSCQIPVIFTKHFYAMASTIGAAIYCMLYYIFYPIYAGIIAMISIVLLRVFASKYRWNLPKV